MLALKIVASIMNFFMMGIIFFFMRELEWKKDKISIIGFSIMQVLYLLNTFCMWCDLW